MLVNKPPMGWNTWNTFGTEPSEDLVKRSADAFIKLGLKDAGYEYIVIDDCWSLYDRDKKTGLIRIAATVISSLLPPFAAAAFIIAAAISLREHFQSLFSNSSSHGASSGH